MLYRLYMDFYTANWPPPQSRSVCDNMDLEVLCYIFIRIKEKDKLLLFVYSYFKGGHMMISDFQFPIPRYSLYNNIFYDNMQ